MIIPSPIGRGILVPLRSVCSVLWRPAGFVPLRHGGISLQDAGVPFPLGLFTIFSPSGVSKKYLHRRGFHEVSPWCRGFVRLSVVWRFRKALRFYRRFGKALCFYRRFLVELSVFTGGFGKVFRSHRRFCKALYFYRRFW